MAARVPELPPPPSPSQPGKCDADKCPWWPYSSTQQFKANTAMILAVLICLLIITLALNALIRYIIVLHSRRRRRFRGNEDVEKVAAEEEIPAVIYSAEMKTSGLEAECAICLSEFSDGDKIKVLEKCKHWFHLQCVQKWLVSQPTCPICRTDCSSKTPSSSSQCMNWD